MKRYMQLMFIFILAVILSLVITLIVSTLITRREAGAAEAEPAGAVVGAIIWQEPCQGGTWIVIEDETYDSWSVWCARFNWNTRTLTWIWGRACEPHYSTKVIVLENILGTPKAVCRYK